MKLLLMSVKRMSEARTFVGDCLEILGDVKRHSVDLAYVDPPFFTQRRHRLSSRDGSEWFSFSDIWDSEGEYSNFMYRRMCLVRDVLKDSGSLFFHCDRSASHITRLVLDSVFGSNRFQSEIIWSFRRWSNSKRGLLPGHQTIFFYSKTPDFKFNTIYQEYSPSTNIDQILQKRVRDNRNKTVYMRDEGGEVIRDSGKKGVPLSDVWDIPFLNPKARERVGFPTQKPVLLMKRIIELVTDEGDLVVDPFCGSGTTLVAAKFLNRNSIGIDISEDAIRLTQDRLENPAITESPLLQKGRDSYNQHSSEAAMHLLGVEYTPVHRNKGIDGLLKEDIDGVPVFLRVQRRDETVGQVASLLRKATSSKGACKLIVIATHPDLIEYDEMLDVAIIPSTAFSLSQWINNHETIEGIN